MGRNSIEELRAAAELQARLCRDSGSPTYAAMIDRLAADLCSGSVAARLLLEDEQEAVGSALYLRLLGGVHRLVLLGCCPELAALYPSSGGTPDPARAAELLPDVVATHEEKLRDEMQVAVQTNEVGRSAVLAGAFGWLARRFDLPLSLREVGASAGLNLWVDRYFVEAAGRSGGPEDAPVRMEGHYLGQGPASFRFRVRDRRGCDLQPVDLTGGVGALRLRSFVWPEDVRRLDRLEKALSCFSPVPLDRAGAADWLREQLAHLPSGCVTVVYHTIVMPYVSESEASAMCRLLDEAGARADRASPLARVSMEPSPDYEAILLECTIWPGGEHFRLATSTPHGEQIRWSPERLVPASAASVAPR